MHYVGYAPLAAAVANAGGLGLVTSLTQKTPELLAFELKNAKALLKPGCEGKIGANLTILPMFSKVNYEEYVDAIIDSGVDVVETAGRPPGEYITKLKKHNIKIIHKCVTTRHAKSAERMGADAISLDGFECGGHPGEEDIGNYVLQAMGARDLTVPFVTSGGVCNGRQLAASLCLGASGINMGTRFMATVEAPIHQNIKQALVEGGSGDTTLVMRSVRNSERVYKNKVALEVQDRERQFPGDFSKIHELVKGENYRISFQETGDRDSSVWSCGTGLALIDDIPTCEELIERIVREAEEALREGYQQVK
jgi:NAD(P)H-dependent flavin oxidoreductase YrpB (nitropropane dioxygenase family)